MKLLIIFIAISKLSASTSQVLNNQTLSQCIFIGKTPKTVTPNATTFVKLKNFANKLFSNEKELNKVLFENEILHKLDPVIPRNIIPELNSTEVMEILVDVFDEFYSVNSTSTTVSYNLPNDRSCTGILNRIKLDSPRDTVGLCEKEDYRSYQINGACLNPNISGVGLSFRSMTRFGEPICSQGCKLPSARNVSLALTKVRAGIASSDTDFVPNILVLFYAQFVVHEISETIEIDDVDVPLTGGCTRNKGKKLEKTLSSPVMDPIEIDCNDPFYSSFGVRCLNFARRRRLNENCKVMKSNFLNTATPCLDLNTVYQIFDVSSQKYISTKSTDGKLKKDKNGQFVIALKNNEQHSFVTAINMAFAIMHDKLVDCLRKLKPNITDDEAFKKAQTINIAFHQHIFYNHTLPTFIGVGGKPVTSTRDTFNSSVKPQITMEYSAAAGRFNHFFVTDFITIANCDTFEVNRTIDFREIFNDVELGQRFFREIICGGAIQPWKTEGITDQIQNFQVFNKDLGYGADLISVDIKRAREACLEPYVNYLRKFFGNCIKNWDDLVKHLGAKTVREFKKMYRNVEDIGLFEGGSAELLIDNSVGRTFTKITIDQYELLRNGDPKFYTRLLLKNQLDQIVKMNFNNFFCIAADLDKRLFDMTIRRLVDFNDIVDCDCKKIDDCLDLSVFL